MSSFNGEGTKVRCIDCDRFSENRCVAKKVKTSAKKRRKCSIYKFKGSFENRETADAMYIPYVSPQTLKLQRKMQKLGIVTAPAEVEDKLVLPASDFFGTTADGGVKIDNLIWTPGSE